MSSFINEIITVISVLGIGALLAFLGKLKLSKRKKDEPKKNTAAAAGMNTVQESFQEELDRIRSATDSTNPADDLADIGNARKR